MNLFKKTKSFLFDNKSVKQTIVKNMFWLSFGQVISRLIRGVAIIYVARAIGAAGYGVFSYALGLAGFFTIFADIGLNAILTREASKKMEEGHRYFATVFWLKVILLALTAMAIVFVAPVFSKIEEATPLLWLVAILTIIDGVRDLSFAFFRSKEKMELEALVNMATNVGIFAFSMTALVFFQSAKAMLVAYVASDALGAVLAVLILRKEFIGVFKNFAREHVKPIINSAWSIAVIVFAGFFAFNLDIIMLGWWHQSTEIGFYAAGQRIVQLFFTIPGIIAGSITPLMSRLAAGENKERMKDLFQYSLRIVLMLALPLTIGGMILGREIIEFLYGSTYLGAVPSFRIFVMVIIINFMLPILSAPILAFDEQRKVVRPIFLASVSNGILNALFIPKFGAAGAATATLMSQFVYMFFVWRISHKMVGFDITKPMWKITKSSAMMGIVVLALNYAGAHVLLNIAVSAAVYFATLLYLDGEILERLKGLRRDNKV